MEYKIMDDKQEDDVSEGLQCSACGCRHLPVDRTLRQGKTIRRYRHCRNCGKHIVTTERIAG